jgi:hypothetical protein
VNNFKFMVGGVVAVSRLDRAGVQKQDANCDQVAADSYFVLLELAADGMVPSRSAALD